MHPALLSHGGCVPCGRHRRGGGATRRLHQGAGWQGAPPGDQLKRRVSRRHCPGGCAAVRYVLRVVAAADECVETAEEEALLARLRLTAGVPPGDHGGPAAHGLVAHGFGRHLGLTVRWRLAALPDGSLFEELTSPQLSFCWGYDAPTDELWEADHVGMGTHLQLDDREVVLLSGFVRTGVWLHPDVQKHLCIRLLDPEQSGALPGDVDHVAGDLRALHPEAEATGKQPPVGLTLRLRRGGRLAAHLRVCPTTGRVLLLWMRVAGDTEVWVFGHSDNHGCLPALVVHATRTGARDVYRTDGVRPLAPLPPAWFSPPPGCMTSLRGCSYDPAAPPALRTERSRSGHLLVRIAVDGADVGWCILDTGASGFVISKAAADAAGMDAFGEVYVAGVGSKVASRFRRCASLTVGPVTFEAPLLLEMSLAGIVWGASGPCVGIVGYDLFRAAVVDIPPHPGTQISVAHPVEWQAPGGLAAQWRWVPVAMVANVPHAWARWHGVPGDGEAELLMLDTGAGGADAIFHARSVARLGLGTVGAYSGTSSIRGVSSSADAAPAGQRASPAAPQEAAPPTQRRQLDWLELVHGPGAPPSAPGHEATSVRFDRVEALMLGTHGAFDLSEHMSGAVCMPLLARTRIVCDLFRRRIAFVAEGADDARVGAA